MRNWRKKVDPIIKDHLEAQIKATSRFRNAFARADNPRNAQLWVAIANLSKQIFDLNLKFRYLEKAVRDLGKERISKKVTKERKKLRKSVKRL